MNNYMIIICFLLFVVCILRQLLGCLSVEDEEVGACVLVVRQCAWEELRVVLYGGNQVTISGTIAESICGLREQTMVSADVFFLSDLPMAKNC